MHQAPSHRNSWPLKVRTTLMLDCVCTTSAPEINAPFSWGGAPAPPQTPASGFAAAASPPAYIQTDGYIKAYTSPKGCTELRLGVSKTKNCQENDGDVRFCVPPQKTSKNKRKRQQIVKNQKIMFSDFLSFTELQGSYQGQKNVSE